MTSPWMVVAVLLSSVTSVVAGPSISFQKDAAVVTGATPGAPIAWLSVARERQGWVTTVVRRDGTGAADRDGALKIPFDSSLSANSGWAVVDLASGEVAFSSPRASGWSLVAATGRMAMARDGGEVKALEDERQLLQILVARPGENPGAWGFSCGDGGEADDDGEMNGIIHASIEAMRQIAEGPPPPKALRAGDVLVAIDPRRCEVYSFRIGQGR